MRVLPAFLLFLAPLYGASVFDAPAVRVIPSPDTPRQIALPAGVRVLDYDVATTGPVVAVLTPQRVQLWDIVAGGLRNAWDVPAGLQARAIAWHPLGDAFFVAGQRDGMWVILRVDRTGNTWQARQIYSSKREIRRLVPGPRPFLVPNPKGKGDVQAYRLFFGTKLDAGGYATQSITEDGTREYQVIGPKDGVTTAESLEADVVPSTLTAASALPVGFHPAGHLLIWENGGGCFQSAAYDRDHWGKSARMFGRDFCGGTVTATPNGMGVLHWTSGTDGIEVLLERGAVKQKQAEGLRLISAPSSVPDGRGIVGLVRNATASVLQFIPLQIPLADVENAWMFTESASDTNLFTKQGGLFRNREDHDQLYQLYDTELYYCGDFDASTPTRPYLVTTDSFWELFAAAYEGTFILRERQAGIPAFWSFVEQAHAALQKAHPGSKWANVFATLGALRKEQQGSAEVQRITKAEGSFSSAVLGVPFDYSELKPRGHYTADTASAQYFKAFHYLTRVASLRWPTAELEQLPAEVKRAARNWAATYQDFIAPGRAPLLWDDSPKVTRSYVKRPELFPQLFPLGWGFDNEALYSTVDHTDWPAGERITGRLQPAALDVAAALGSNFAIALLGEDMARHPQLKSAITALQARNQTVRNPTLYDQWLSTLAQQWADTVPSPGGPLDEGLWRTKRLQTGLASWATLRHATVLVNERVSAECGEAGFEAIVMRPPRGYVEPDPATFGSIAGMFTSAAAMIGKDAEAGKDNGAALQQGLIKRLNETAAKARLFQSIAEKELRGEAPSAQDYEEILYFGRVAEHHFLVFKSLANKDLALSTPNPIPKIVEIAGVRGGPPYQMVAVGRPLEWNHVVPFYGRREIVKGPVYSFYEFSSPGLMNDAEWLKQVSSRQRPAWVTPYVTEKNLSCPARKPF